MYDMIRNVRVMIIVGFVLFIIYKVLYILFIPTIVFILIMKLFSKIKLKTKKTDNKKTDSNKIIDGEFEDLD